MFGLFFPPFGWLTKYAHADKILSMMQPTTVVLFSHARQTQRHQDQVTIGRQLPNIPAPA